jgi:hypothetical protein
LSAFGLKSAFNDFNVQGYIDPRGQTARDGRADDNVAVSIELQQLGRRQLAFFMVFSSAGTAAAARSLCVPDDDV